MKRRVFKENEILHILDQYLHGDVCAEEVFAKHNIDRETLDRWCRRYGQITWSAAMREVRNLRREIRRLNDVIKGYSRPNPN